MSQIHFSPERQSLPDELGHLVINENGTVLQASGQLENDNHIVKVITAIVNALERNKSLTTYEGTYNNITIQYDDHLYNIIIDNKVTVIKRSYVPSSVDV